MIPYKIIKILEDYLKIKQKNMQRLSNLNEIKQLIQVKYVKVTKSFGEEHSEINYDITAHTNGYINFIPSSSPISEEKLFNSPEEMINSIKIKS